LQCIAHGGANQNCAPGILIEQLVKESVRPAYDVNHQAFHLFIAQSRQLGPGNLAEWRGDEYIGVVAARR
jgi:hypothetical protein